MKDLLFSFQGRITRTQFWVCILVIFALSNLALFPLLMVGFSSIPRFFSALIYAGIVIPLSWMVIAVTAKRLHDRNKSGWYFLLYFFVLYGLIEDSERIAGGTLLWLAVTTTGVAGLLWVVVDLGVLRGTKGTNTFGADPLASVNELLRD